LQQSNLIVGFDCLFAVLLLFKVEGFRVRIVHPESGLEFRDLHSGTLQLGLGLFGPETYKIVLFSRGIGHILECLHFTQKGFVLTLAFDELPLRFLEIDGELLKVSSAVIGLLLEL
jgi:hypothetical protein